MPRAVRRLGKPDHSRITIHNNDGIFVINLEDIQYIEMQNRRILVFTTAGALSCTGTMQAIENQLPASFFRCHSAFVINLQALECLKGQDVIVAGKLIPVSKHRRSELVRSLTDFVGDKL